MPESILSDLVQSDNSILSWTGYAASDEGSTSTGSTIPCLHPYSATSMIVLGGPRCPRKRAQTLKKPA